MIKYFYAIVIMIFFSQETLFGQVAVNNSTQKIPSYQKSDSKVFANNLEIYPNPASHKILISNTSKDQVEITIFNIVGHPLVTKQSGIKDVEINIEDLSDGVYIVSINNGRDVVTQRLVKRS